MIIKFFGYPILFSASSETRTLNVSFTTLSAILFGIKSMISTYSQHGKINAIVRRFPLIPNPSFLDMQGYDIVKFGIPSDGEHFLNSSTMAIDIKGPTQNIEVQQWILEFRKPSTAKKTKKSELIAAINPLPNGKEIDI